MIIYCRTKQHYPSFNNVAALIFFLNIYSFVQLGEQSAPPRPKVGRRSNAGLCVGTVLFILLSLCLEYTGLLSLSHAHRRTEKSNDVESRLVD